MIRGAVAAGLMAVVLPACSIDSAEEWHAKWGGPYERYVRVFSETDCSALERTIVTEVARVDELRKADDIRATQSHIQATYRRMVALDCPQAFR